MKENTLDKLSLTESIKRASEGSAQDIALFFNTLLEADIYYSVIKDNTESSQKNFSIPIIGAEKIDPSGDYPIIDYEGNKCIPIFSEEDFVINWENKECEIKKESFKTFIFAIPNTFWLYLNGGQDYGKEISSWEVSLLKLGSDSINELVSGVSEAEQEDFEVTDSPSSLDKLKENLLPILKVYKELSEAYLLSFKESSSNTPRALVGLKFDGEIDPDNKRYVREQIDATSLDHLPKDFSSVLIIDDLGDVKSFNQTLFLDSSPFYKREVLK